MLGEILKSIIAKRNRWGTIRKTGLPFFVFGRRWIYGYGQHFRQIFFSFRRSILSLALWVWFEMFSRRNDLVVVTDIEDIGLLCRLFC